MSISGISTSSAYDQTNLSALYHQRRRDFKAIEAAVQRGDLTGAQQAVTAWQKDVQAIQSARGESAGPGTYSPPLSQFKTDVTALVDAIQGGDILSRGQ
jgi:hypothetical protein